MKKRNCTIDCLKFVFAWIIVFFHFYGGTSEYFAGGYFAVEFFLLAASVFFFSRVERHPDGETAVAYISRRFLRFFPWTFSVLLAWVVAKGIISPFSGFGELLDYLVGNLSEFFFIKMNGIVTLSGFMNLPAWTVSSMLIVEFVLHYCYSRWKDVFTQFIAPLSIIVGLGIWANLAQARNDTWVVVTTFGTFRAWVVYCAGYCCFSLSKKWRAVPLNYRGEIVFTCLECICYALSIWAMIERTGRLYQWSVMFALTIGVAISVSGHSLLGRALDSQKWLRKTSVFLGGLSLSVFLTHGPLLNFFTYLFPEMEVRDAYQFHFVLLVLVCSLTQWYIVSRCIRVARKVWPRIKGGLTVA